MNDIVDTVSLKKLYSKEEIITLGSGKCIVDTNDGQMITYSNGVQVSKGIMNEEGFISVDENGQLEMTGIPLGKYQVVEVSCPQGYVLDSTPYDFEITQKIIQQQFIQTLMNKQIKLLRQHLLKPMLLVIKKLVVLKCLLRI